MGYYRVTKSIEHGDGKFQPQYRPVFWPFWFDLHSRCSNESWAWDVAKEHKKNASDRETCFPCVLLPLVGGAALMAIIFLICNHPNRLGVRTDRDCTVLEIERNSAAHKSGMRTGDRIIRTDVAENCFREDVRKAKEVTVIRDGKELTINIIRK